MEGFTEFGSNRTGIQTSPKLTKELLKAVRDSASASDGDQSALSAARLIQARESEPLGTVPPLKTGAKASKDLSRNVRAQVLVDRIAERLAFERTGVRLYEALIVKHAAYADQLSNVPVEKLMQIHDEEAEHFAMLAEVLQSLGADPTAQTPAADLVGIQGMGLMQAITEPRTTFVQALCTILIAELADNDGWEMLINLATSAGLADIVERFRVAREQEDEHLDQVRTWLLELSAAELSGSEPLQAKGTA
jgi:rubrerythrin